MLIASLCQRFPIAFARRPSCAFAIVFLFICARIAFAEGSQLEANAQALQNVRHAYHYYTTALAEKDDDARLKFLTRAIEFDPNLYRAYFSRGVLHAKNNARHEAEADFVRATELYPDFMTAHYNLACLRAKSDQKEAALASLETSLQKGYRRFDKLRQDDDLVAIAKSEEFERLVSHYDELAKTAVETPLQKLQTAAVGERAKIVSAELENPSQIAAAIAGWAMYESDGRTREIAMQLWRKIDHENSRESLAVGLYDVNSDVCKTAANSLVTYGKPISETIRPILADQELGAPFYAMQIVSRVDARECFSDIVPYLKHSDPKNRMMAAQCLAELQARKALPEIKTALENAPAGDRGQGAYRALLERAIKTLEGDG